MTRKFSGGESFEEKFADSGSDYKMHEQANCRVAQRWTIEEGGKVKVLYSPDIARQVKSFFHLLLILRTQSRFKSSPNFHLKAAIKIFPPLVPMTDRPARLFIRFQSASAAQKTFSSFPPGLQSS
jgi:hypothetical protein